MENKMLTKIIIDKNNVFESWKNLTGESIDFIYDGENVSIDILDVFYKGRHITLKCKYKDKIEDIKKSTFEMVGFKNLIGKKPKYKYNVGDVVSVNTGQIKILEQTKMNTKGRPNSKAYKYICLNDNVIGESLEGNILKGQGCAVCASQRVVKGVNDISTTHPKIAKLFKNINEAYTNTYGTKKKFSMICPKCGTEKESSVIDIIKNGFSCPKCGDKISNPQKIMYYILEKNKIDFVCEKMFDWSNSKRYDFYIPSLSTIIETHGKQHYEESGARWRRTLAEEQENDRLKERIAKENGIENYIVIDCRESNIDKIFKNIKNSKKLKEILNLSEISIDDLSEYCSSTIVQAISDLWNKGMDLKEISDTLKYSRFTILKYIKIASKLGWCNFVIRKEAEKQTFDNVIELWNSGIKDVEIIAKLNNISRNTVTKKLKKGCELGVCDYSKDVTFNIGIEKRRKQKYKKVACINNGEILESSLDACKKYNIDKSNICECLKGKVKYAGVDYVKNEGLLWMYYDEYIKLSDEQIQSLKEKNVVKFQKVICTTTREIFNSITEARKIMNVKYSQIYKCCIGECKYGGKHQTTKEQLKWEYYYDNISV